MKFNLSPINILTYYLTLLMLIGTLSQAGLSLNLWFVMMRNLLLIFAGAYAIYLPLLKTKRIIPTRFEHRYITCFILFLLFYMDAPWYVFLGLGAGAELLQRFIRLPTGPLMNPAGLITTIVAFLGIGPLWWGASFSPRLPIAGGISVAVFLTVPFAMYVAYKYKKLKIVGAFLVTFTLAFLLLLKNFPLFILLEGTLLFYTLVMVVEPKTSPVMLKDQLIYGGALGILVAASIKFGLFEPYAPPLILCNLIFNLYRNRKMLAMKFNKPAPHIAQPTPPAQTGSATMNG